MRLRAVVSSILAAISTIGGVLYFFVYLGLLPSQMSLSAGAELMHSPYLLLVALCAFSALPCWIVYNIARRQLLKLNPELSHVYAALFYPEEMNWGEGEAVQKKAIPIHKAIVNGKTNRAYEMGDYAINLVVNRKVQAVRGTWKGEQPYEGWLEERGIKLIRKPATPDDLYLPKKEGQEKGRAEAERPPTFQIKKIEELEDMRLKEIRVRIRPNEFNVKRGKFQFLSVSIPSSSRTIEHIVPHIKLGIPNMDKLLPLKFIERPGKPWVSVGWPGVPEEFMPERDGFASALIHNKDRKPVDMTLYGGGKAEEFLLLFSVEDRESIYFATESHIAVKIPRKFQLELYIQAKDLPLVKASTFEVSASTWNNFNVTQLDR